ncbi:glycosyltransferase [Neobacillus sp. Marseille-QA0830]
MKYLILIDTKFPYRAGETFLETEIQEISSSFDKIFIFPIDAIVGDEQTRPIIAENVTTIPFETGNTLIRKCMSAVKALLTMWTYDGKYKHKFRDAYFESAAKAQARKIINHLSKIRFNQKDQIYVYSYWFYIGARVTVEIKNYFLEIGIPVKAVSRAHGFDIYENYHKSGYLPRREFLLDNIDRVFTCSNNGSYHLKKKYPIYTNKIITSHLGTYDHGEGITNRNKRLHIVSCSRVVPIKRVDKIIDALKLLEKEGYRLSWTHIGGGELLDILKNKASAELEGTEVHFTGAVANSDVYEFYSQIPTDLFINVSSSEGLPVSIMEAISYGIPVIATNVGGTSEIVVDKVSGSLLSLDFSDRELATSIANIARLSDEEYCQLRASTRNFWLENFQATKNYKKFASDVLYLVKEG